MVAVIYVGLAKLVRHSPVEGMIRGASPRPDVLGIAQSG